jgi:tetratricopeptide (TPR) repeat protein
MSTERVPFFKDLLKRRVPQILGGYLGGSWIIVEFLDWLVKRYPISPHLVEFGLVILASMIPTVLLLAYYHGKPGPDKITRIEKIGIPTNLIASVILLLLLFHGEDLGATTTTVKIVNEQGEQVERSVPKSEFRKSLAIFSFENESGNAETEWLTHAIPGMLQYDLLLEIGDLYSEMGEFEQALEYYQEYAEAFPNNVKSFVKIGQLYETVGDYEQARSNYKNALLIEPDKFSISVALSKIEGELGHFDKALNEYHELLDKFETPEERYRIFTHLENYYFTIGKIVKSVEYMDLKLDEMAKFIPSFGVLNRRFQSLGKYVLAGRSDEAFQIVREAEEQLGPPLDQMIPYGYLDLYIELKDIPNAEKALEAAIMILEATQMEVNRTVILRAQGRIHELKGEYAQAVSKYSDQLELEPTQANIHISLGHCYRLLQDYKQAEEHLQKVMKIHPFWPDANFEMAMVYNKTGKNEEALEHMKRAQLIWEEADPDYQPAIDAREKLAEMENSGN